MKNLAKRLIIFVILACALPVAAAPQKMINKNAALKALDGYNQTLMSNPNSEDALINRAYINYILGNIELAIEDYDKLILINPKNEEFYLNRGYLKHIYNRRDAALKDYDMAIKIKPAYAFAYNNRGVVLAELGRESESLNAYNAAIKIDPNYADAYYNRGNLKTKTEHNEEALEDFNTAIKLNPSDSASFNNRGVVKRKLNFNVGALSDFTIAIKLNPEDITAFANRGRLKKRYFDSEGAEEDFKNAIAIAEESPILIKEMEVQSQITAMQKENKHVEKTQEMPILRESKPDDTNLHKIAHKVPLEQSSQPVKASVVKVDPKTNKSDSIANVKTDVTPEITTKPVTNPKLAECYYIRALQKYILQNRESALADFDMAIKYNPEYAEAYYYRAAIKRDFKDEGFVEDYTKAIQIDPSLKAVNDADVLMILKI